MKRILSILVVCCMLISSFVIPAYAEEAETPYVPFSTDLVLKNYADGTVLLAANLPTVPARADGYYENAAIDDSCVTQSVYGASTREYNGLAGYTGGADPYIIWSGDANCTLVATKTKMPQSKKLGYYIESDYSGWIQFTMDAGNLRECTKIANGSKTIINFSAMLPEGNSKIGFWPYHANASGGNVNVYGNGQYPDSDVIRFENGTIYLGGRYGSYKFANNPIGIGTYEIGKEYEVTIVETTPPADGTNKCTIEAIYLNDTKIYPTTDMYYSMTAAGTFVSLRNMTMYTSGNVYAGDINVYVTDDYTLPTVALKSTAPSKFALNKNSRVITARETTVGVIKSYIEAPNGITWDIYKSDGTVAGNDEVLGAEMLLKASKGYAETVYTFNVANVVAMSSFANLAGLSDGTSLYEGTINDDKSNGSYVLTKTSSKVSGGNLYGWGSTASPQSQNPPTLTAGEGDGTVKFEKTTFGTSGSAGIKVTMTEDDDNNDGAFGGHHINAYSSEDLLLDAYIENGTKTIINYKVNLGYGAEASFAPRHASSRDNGGRYGRDIFVEEWDGWGDRLTFKDGKIYLGTKKNVAYGTDVLEIGTYNNNEEYDIVIVEKTPSREDNPNYNGTSDKYLYYGDTQLVIEKIYLNGEEIFPYRNGVAVDVKNEGAVTPNGYVMNVTGGGTPFVTHGIWCVYTMDMRVSGNLTFGAQLYMADTYIAPDASGIEIESLADNLTVNVDEISGWANYATVGALLAKLDSDIDTTIYVVDENGEKASASSALEAGMKVRVAYVSYGAIYKEYELALPYYKFTETESGISVVCGFKPGEATEGRKINLIISAYAGGVLTDIGFSEVLTVGDNESYTLSASVADKTANEYRAFLWEEGTYLPIIESERFVK